MASKIPQPVLPPPRPFSEIEATHLQEEPEFFWPDNQDSNFGSYRRVFSERLMDVLGQLNLIYNERFIDTAFQFLAQWEEQMGLPQNPGGKTVDERRYKLHSRMYKGPFTNAIRRQVVEDAINATFGPAIQLTTHGVPLLPGGVPIYSGLSGPASKYYHIIENVSGYSYNVSIDYRIIPDLAWLTQELKRITPAGITFTITSYQPTTFGTGLIFVGGGTKRITFVKTGGSKYNSNAGGNRYALPTFRTYPYPGAAITSDYPA